MEQAQSEAAKQEVSERALQRWDLLLHGQLDKAYEYFSPASRLTLPLELFQKRSAGGRWWRKIDLEKVDCSVDACQVRMILEYDLRDIKGLKTSIDETWIKDAGTWWLVAAK